MFTIARFAATTGETAVIWCDVNNYRSFAVEVDAVTISGIASNAGEIMSHLRFP